MFKRDPTGRWVFSKKYLEPGQDIRSDWKAGYRFYSGKACTAHVFEEKEYNELVEYQKREPVTVLRMSESKKRCWMFMDEFYYEDEGFSKDEVKVLILDMVEKRKKKVQRAQTRLRIGTGPNEDLREIIPDEIKAFVWQRDAGKCIRCGSREKLEFDHVIPIAKGGSNTARNIQLLCEKCNREKGANLF